MVAYLIEFIEQRCSKVEWTQTQTKTSASVIAITNMLSRTTKELCNNFLI